MLGLYPPGGGWVKLVPSNREEYGRWKIRHQKYLDHLEQEKKLHRRPLLISFANTILRRLS